MNFEYEKYIHSNEWIEFKNKYYSCHKKCCFVCKTNKNIHLHHKTYKNFKNEKYEDVIPLCENCHSKIHEKLKNNSIKENNKILVELKNNITNKSNKKIKQRSSCEKEQFIPKIINRKNKNSNLCLINIFSEIEIEKNKIRTKRKITKSIKKFKKKNKII